jgi:hypothetical protein
MNKEEIQKSNILIAKFMGWNKEDIYDHGRNGKRDILKKEKDSSVYISISELASRNKCYHNSWDWLMPVVEKIAGYDYATADIHWGTGCTDSFAWCDILWEVHKKKKYRTPDNLNIDEQSLITAVYISVVDFIKWYNKNICKL